MKHQIVRPAVCIGLALALSACSAPFKAAGQILHGFGNAAETIGDGIEGTLSTVEGFLYTALYAVTVWPVKTVVKAFKKDRQRPGAVHVEDEPEPPAETPGGPSGGKTGGSPDTNRAP